MPPSSRGLSAVFLITGLALLLLSVRFALIGKFGGDLPFQDSWNKEGDWVLGPIIEGKPWLQRFLLPHNEHRIYCTLALDLVLVLATGQWDARVQAAVSTLLAALILISLSTWVLKHFSIRASAFILVGLTAVSVSPIAWDNIVWGFQSQFYFLIGFSLLALHGVLFTRVGSGHWWLSATSGILALFTMGSGFFWACAALLPLFLQWLQRQKTLREVGPSGIVVLAVIVAGWWLSFSPPWHVELRAKHLSDFAFYAFRCLAWPTPQWPWLALLWNSPLLLGIAQIVRRRRVEPSEMFGLACSVWTLSQAAALAFARGNIADVPASRYGDVFAIGIFANLIFVGVWVGDGKPLLRLRVGLAYAWSILLLGALLLAGESALTNALPAFKANLEACTATVRNYVRTENPAYLDQGPLPLPYKDWMKTILDRPGIRQILPASIRTADPSKQTCYMSRTSFAVFAVTESAWLLALASTASFVTSLFLFLRSRNSHPTLRP
jgi:hypothetical protein